MCRHSSKLTTFGKSSLEFPTLTATSLCTQGKVEKANRANSQCFRCPETKSRSLPQMAIWVIWQIHPCIHYTWFTHVHMRIRSYKFTSFPVINIDTYWHIQIHYYVIYVCIIILLLLCILTCFYDSWKGGTECIGIVGHNGHPPVFATGTNRGILETITTGEWGTPRTLSSILQETSWIVDTAGDGR